MPDTLPTAQAQRRLAILWFAVATGPTLLFYNNIQGRFDDPAAIWQWYSLAVSTDWLRAKDYAGPAVPAHVPASN